MSLSASCESVAQKRTLSSLLAGRVVKKPKQGDGEQLHKAAIQLLEQHQDLRSLFREVGSTESCNAQQHPENKASQRTDGISSEFSGSLMACELRRQAAPLGVSVTVLSAKVVLERLREITEGPEEGEQNEGGEMLSSPHRVQLCALMESSRELLSQGALCPKLLWQEYRREQSFPKLEVVYFLHFYNILTLKYILESDEGVRSWLVPQLKALCGWIPPQGEEESERAQQKVLETVVGVLVGTGFNPTTPHRKISLLCCSILDDMLFWLLDTVDTVQPAATGPLRWIRVFDASLCGASASPEALQRFFTHSLTQTLTYKPRLTVSDAISQQIEWTFAKASRSLTSLFRKLSASCEVEQLLSHLQQVLETHEVNWKHVLCFLSTLLVYYLSSQTCLRELLSRLLSSAFEDYDLENLITAFLLARQGALEGPAVFPSYIDWFKMSFGGGTGYHASSKKSLVFLLKFLSDLVPFEPSQYLKVHILHPPFVPVKHRSLLTEYVSLAKTRLADLKESVEDMGLYEDVSGAGGSVQPQCQAAQDVGKAVSLFESTGRISATVMEARADKIPGAQYSSYLDSCLKQRQQNKGAVCLDSNDDPLEVLKVQLQEFAELLVGGDDGEMFAQLSRVSHTLGVIFPGRPDELISELVLTLSTETSPSAELHGKVVNMILRHFCQCLLNASRANPPNKQSLWASRYVSMIFGNKQLLSSVMNRLWDLFHNQGSALSAAHLLGLAAFVVHLNALMAQGPLVRLVPPFSLQPVTFGEALSLALRCNTGADMLFCVRLCVAAVCYGICMRDSLPPEEPQEFIPNSLFKRLLYLVPRLMPEARRSPSDTCVSEREEEALPSLWSSVIDSSWRRTAWLLWRHAAFQQLEQMPQHQLGFSEWLHNELRVQRSEDALSDAQRQEYEQWACMELYLTLPEEQGGCGGDVKNLCSKLLNAVISVHLRDPSMEGESQTGTCYPDILSRLQELVYEMQLTKVGGGRGNGADLCDFLFEVLSQRCSSTASVSAELSLQCTIHTWNRVLLALPAVLFIKVKAEAGRTTLDCSRLTEHVNTHQRKACSPSGFLPFHITAHFLKGLFCASVQCRHPEEEVNRVWSQMGVCCPLLLVSTVHWWRHLSPLLVSLWRRLRDAEALPEQLQLLSDCHNWACSLEKGQLIQTPPAAALLLAASLHRAWREREGNQQSFTAALNSLRPERDAKHRQVLVFLLFLCVNDYLSALLYPQEDIHKNAKDFCADLLTVLVDAADWLLILKPNGAAQTEPSLLLQQSADLLQRTAGCPGFLHAAVACYTSMLQLFLEGRTPSAGLPEKQVDVSSALNPHLKTNEDKPNAHPELPVCQLEPAHILGLTKRFLLSLISQTSPATLTSAQLRQLEAQCAELDPELAAALSLHLDPPSLSPEMDFL
ncbi:unnamed protein product [Menidia menidia]|uniref:(Atlantic silverside) hypothetical protein n=1 Tax=Menidia menidia TaxID=238744 RepID=A0A8S4BCT0_9TELE|nr:unnamed protein product [Menidia menidia]